MEQIEIDTGLGKLMIPELTRDEAKSIIVGELDRRIGIVCGIAMVSGAPQNFIDDSEKQHLRYEHLKSIVDLTDEKNKEELATAVREIAFDAFIGYRDLREKYGEEEILVAETRGRAANFFAAARKIEQ